jgi:hypothetical protein
VGQDSLLFLRGHQARDLVAGCVQLGKRSSRGSAQTSGLLRTRSSDVVEWLDVVAVTAAGKPTDGGALFVLLRSDSLGRLFGIRPLKDEWPSGSTTAAAWMPVASLAASASGAAATGMRLRVQRLAAG